MNNFMKSLKNSRIKNIMVASSLCSALLFSGASLAMGDVATSDSDMKPAHKSERMMKRMAKKLDLTDSQQAEILAIKQNSKTEMEALKPALKAYKEQVNTLLSAETFDEQAFTQLQSSNQDVFAAQALIRAKTKFQMKQVLTSEQFEKLNKSQRKFKHKRKQRS
ncbi:Spy/CpxP family protein refolding chaperone [Colwellia sp. D2M02]|uniref:Spy/CpxP family protein refolding chaperone n=1 Tax=Colwellia sp. D2M02 TaxID=2841562 RepID=UPI00209004F6|nr:Spy/CpxP family protein refolding chaperone [Colwellia sp. D2M02]